MLKGINESSHVEEGERIKKVPTWDYWLEKDPSQDIPKKKIPRSGGKAEEP